MNLHPFFISTLIKNQNLYLYLYLNDFHVIDVSALDI